MHTAFLEKYSAAADSLEKTVARRNEAGILSAFGYASNLDLLCSFRPEELSRFVTAELADTDPEKVKPSGRVENAKALAETVLYYCRNGLGGEADIEDAGALSEIVGMEKAIGGTGVQASLALASVGGSVLSHLTDASEEVLSLLSVPGIYVVSPDGTLSAPAALVPANEAEPHYIIQYRKGEVIRAGRKEYVIPASNRLILTRFTINDRLPLNPAHLEWIEKNASRVPGIMLSGFNCVPQLPVLLEVLSSVRAHVRRFRAARPEGIVYYEEGDFHRDELKRAVLEHLYPEADVVGMNEEELVYTLRMLGQDADAEDVFSCIRGVKTLISRFSVRKGMVIHTKDYAMYVGTPLNADIESGLMYGSLMAAAKARHGSFGTMKEVREALLLPPGEKGLAFRAAVEKSEYRDSVILVPSRYMDRPKYTIGLGDAFTAGVQLCF